VPKWPEVADSKSWGVQRNQSGNSKVTKCINRKEESSITFILDDRIMIRKFLISTISSREDFQFELPHIQIKCNMKERAQTILEITVIRHTFTIIRSLEGKKQCTYFYNEALDFDIFCLTNSVYPHDSLLFNSRIPPWILHKERQVIPRPFYAERWQPVI